MPNGWGGNRQSGVLLALHHRLKEGYSGELYYYTDIDLEHLCH